MSDLLGRNLDPLEFIEFYRYKPKRLTRWQRIRIRIAFWIAPELED